MSKKLSVKSIGIILLISANIAVIIALVLSIKTAIGKIEVGKEIETEKAQEEETQEDLTKEELAFLQEQKAQENVNQNEQNKQIYMDEEEKEDSITLKQVIAGLNYQNTSIVEIILVLVGIALFILGIILIKFVKKMG